MSKNPLTLIFVLGAFPWFAYGAPCANVPAKVQSAFQVASDYRSACVLTSSNSERTNIGIGDFSSENGSSPYLYVFDKNGKCLGRFLSSFGKGRPTNQSRLTIYEKFLKKIGYYQKPGAYSTPVPGNSDNSNLTPEGMLLTAPISAKSKFEGTDALLESGLEGQGSGKRHVYIHADDQPGTADTEGCTGVSAEDLTKINQLLGTGSLVYNYFGTPSDYNHDGKQCTNKTYDQETQKLHDEVLQGADAVQ